MKTRFFTLIALLSLVLAACAAAAPSSRDYNSGGAPVAQPPAPQAPATGNTSGGEYASVVPEVKRMILKDANLSMAVNDPAKSLDAITKMTDSMGGFVVNASLNTTRLESGADVPHASITLRVPAERLDEALTTIKQETTRPVLSEEVKSQDVTKEYTDLDSRLKNLQAAESQLQEIMTQAVKTEDVLSVYQQLVQVREQIEVIKGQMQYYEQAAAMSSITVDLMANEAVQPLTIGSWQPGGVAKDAIQALINTVKGLATASIWIVLFIIPVLILVSLPFLALFFIIRAILRRQKQKALVAKA